MSAQAPSLGTPLRSFQVMPFQERLHYILIASLPTMAGMLSNTMLNTVDFLMLGSLGSEVLAAAALSGNIAFVFVGILGSVAVAVQSMVSRRYGQGQPAECGKAMFNGVVMSAVFGVVGMGLCYLLTPQILGFFSQDAHLVQLATPYLQWRFLGVIPFLLMMAFRGFFNGLGRTMEYLYAALIMNISNILFNGLFIHGNSQLGIPAYGLTGAGLGTFASLMMGASFFLLRTGDSTIRRTYTPWRWQHLDFSMIRSMAWLALPTGIEGGIMIGSFALFQKFLGTIGSEHMATAGLTINIFSYLFLLSVGLGQSGAALVGHHLGAKEYLAAFELGKMLLRMSFIISSMVALSFAIYGAALMSIFTDDPVVIMLGEGTLAIIAIVGIFDALAMVLVNILQAAGFSGWCMVSHAGINVVVFMPLTWLFAVQYQLGSHGGFGAFGIYIIIFFLVAFHKFMSKNWMYRQI